MLDLSMGIRLTSAALRRGAGAALGQSALYQSLEAGDYWPLDEASGTRASAFNSQTLTDNNTVGSDTGKVYALAADFVAANSEYLSRASEARLQTGDIDFWVAGWINLASTSNPNVVARWGGTAGSREYLLRPHLFFLHDGAAQESVGSGVTLTTGSWFFCMGWHDSVNNVFGIRTNATENTKARTAGVPVTAANFEIARDTNISYASATTGPVYFGKNYVPTAADRSFLWNDGNGRTLAEVEAYSG